jgi:hypothetical protein
MIQVKQGPRNNVQGFPFNMVNMLHLVIDNSCNNNEEGQDEALKLWGFRY